jgi:hypothetical protein
MNAQAAALDRALCAAASRAQFENAAMVVYRQTSDPASVFVQHASLPLPPGAEALKEVCAPGAQTPWELPPVEDRLERIRIAWSNLAGEPVTIIATEDWTYAHGSELAVLRLYWKMRGAGQVEKRESGWVYFKKCCWG